MDNKTEKNIEDLGYDELVSLIEVMESPPFTQVLVPLFGGREDRHVRTLIRGESEHSCDKARGGISELGWTLSLHDVAVELAGELKRQAEDKGKQPE